MPTLNTPAAARRWINARAAQKPASEPRTLKQIIAAGNPEIEAALELLWHAPLGVRRPCGCPSDVAVFGHTRCPLAGA